jgi:hypothetical protein
MYSSHVVVGMKAALSSGVSVISLICRRLDGGDAVKASRISIHGRLLCFWRKSTTVAAAVSRLISVAAARLMDQYKSRRSTGKITASHEAKSRKPGETIVMAYNGSKASRRRAAAKLLVAAQSWAETALGVAWRAKASHCSLFV